MDKAIKDVSLTISPLSNNSPSLPPSPSSEASTSSTIDDDSAAGIENICLNIDKYLDELEQTMNPKGFQRNNSLSKSSNTSKVNSTIGKSFTNKASPLDFEFADSTNKSNEHHYLTLPYQNLSSTVVSTPFNHSLKLQWRNLSYTSDKDFSITSKSSSIRKIILDQQSGEICGGQLTAIIGPSGAGKSTLLGCLAGRMRKGLKGDIYVICDSQYLNNNRILRVSYIGQKDQLIEKLTVRETLTFATKLKNTHYPCNRYYHRKLVESILQSLHLDRCGDVRVSSISGGQLKRLTFAIELISGPDIIMLDEPTSGLDSSATYHCVHLFRKLTDLSNCDAIYKPPAILCTIHQPSARVLNIFHQIYVLACDGRCIYQGPPATLVDHLMKFSLSCPSFHNPADFIIEIASGDYGFEPMNSLACYENRRQIELINEEKIYLSCSKFIINTSLSTSTSSSLSTTPNQIKLGINRIVGLMKNQSFPLFTHFFLLLHRTYLITLRDSKLTWFRFGQAIFIGTLMSFLYDYPIGEPNGCFNLATLNTNESFNSLQSTQDNIAFIFFITLFTVMACMMPTVLTFPSEVKVHIQERNNGWYSGWTYYWSKIIADTPYQILITIIFCSIVYPSTGQIWSYWRFSLFTLNSLIVSNIAQCVGMLFGTIYVKSVQNAVFMAPLSMAPVFLLSGFFGKISKVPIFLKPIAYISYVRYAFESFLIIIYGYKRCDDIILDNNNNANTSITNNDRHISLQSNVTYTSDVIYFKEKPVYDSLPNVWSGFYNPMDYLVLDDSSNNNNNSNSSAMSTKIKSGSIILDHFDLTDDHLWQNMIILMTILTILRLIAYCVLIIKTNERK